MIAIPAWIYAVAATTAFAGVSWLVLCAFQVGYRLGRLCAFKEIERKHDLIRDARVWFIVIHRPGCPKLGREATPAPWIKTISDGANHRDLARKARARLN